MALYGGLSVFAMLGIGLLVVLGGAVAIGFSSYLNIASAIPANVQAVAPDRVGDQPTLLLDREARRVIYRISPLPGSTPWVTLETLPPYVWQAALAMEDADFLARPEFSPAALVDALARSVTNGQVGLDDPLLLYLARHVLVPLSELPSDDPNRNFTDTILILELRRRFSREELLGWYLNTALYGNGAYGIEAAAQLYFGKGAADLSLAEAAALAGIPAAPSVNPFDQPDAAYQRQQVVLDSMAAYGMLVPADADAARVRLDVTRPLAPSDVVAPHFALAARRQAEAVLNAAGYDGARLVASGAVKITTSLDLDLQYQAECALRTQVTRLGGVDPSFVYATSIGDACQAAEFLPALAAQDVGVPHDVSNGAVVITRATTGEVLAYVGSVDYWNEGLRGYLDLADAREQPGSLIRPYIYLAALAQGYTAATMTLDVQRQFEQTFGLTLDVGNPTGAYQGPISLRQALVSDAAPSAVEVMNWVGVADVVRTAHRMGLNTLRDGPSSYDLSLALDGGDTRLADLTYSFGVLANAGRMVGTPIPVDQQQPGYRALDPVLVLSIEDSAGNVLWEYQPQARDILDSALAYLMNNMLSDRELRAQMYGVDNVYETGRPAAVYSGGTPDQRGMWTVGYTPQLSVGVWLGNADQSAMSRLTAANGPAPIWNAVLQYAHLQQGLPPADWQQPSSVVETAVCALSGLLPTQNCPVVSELFAQGTQPTQQDYYYQMVEVNRQNGLRATASTPRDLVSQQVYFDYPPAAQAWAAANGIASAPQAFDSVGAPVVLGPVAILTPEPFDYVGGALEVRGNASLPGFQYYQLAYGQGLNPVEWSQIGERTFTPARGALLGRWNTAGLQGLYSLRLTVVTSDQSVEESVIQVTVDNVAPQISLTSPLEGDELRVAGANPVLDAALDYSDNVGVVRVVYYLDGEPAATVTEAPFAGALVLDSLGAHSLWAEAFDAAGNSGLSERVSFTVRRSE